MNYKRLIEMAMAGLERAYSPYSHFKTAAALETEDGKVFVGANMENADYSASCSAEMAALACAVSSGCRNFRRIVIVGGPDGHVTDFCPPTGEGRQALNEFCSPMTFEVVLARSPEDYKLYVLEELLPLAFGPKHV